MSSFILYHYFIIGRYPWDFLTHKSKQNLIITGKITKNDKQTNNIKKNNNEKLKTEQHESDLKPEVIPRVLEG